MTEMLQDSKNRSYAKSASAFKTISEVSSELDVPQHVLRFWESKFAQLRPLKRGGGRRYYRPEDVDLLKRIHGLLYSDGYTIKGVQRLLKGGKAKAGDKELVLGEKSMLQKDLIEAAETSLEVADGVMAEVMMPAIAVNRAERPKLSAAQRAALENALKELHEIRSLLQAM